MKATIGFALLGVLACGTPPAAQLGHETRALTGQGPVAVISGGPFSGAAPLAVYLDATTSYTTDPNGWIAAFAWDLGDGTTTTAGWMTHTYASPGSYTVTLTATDGTGATSTATQQIVVSGSSGGSTSGGSTSGGSSGGSTGGTTGGTSGGSSGGQGPVAVISGGPYSGSAPLAVYLDATNSSTTDPNGWIAAFAWDLGDGTTTTEAWMTHTYASPGTYTVTLTATDGTGATSTATQVIQVSGSTGGSTSGGGSSGGSTSGGSTSGGPGGPVAVIQGNFAGPVPFNADFVGSGSHTTTSNATIVAWAWAFGDGATDNLQSTSHVYRQIGTYTATLTVTDSTGATGSATQAVHVEGQPPVAVLQGGYFSGTAPLNVYFDATASYSNDPNRWIAGFAWKLDDGFTSTDGWFEHTLQSEGVHTVTVTVTDDTGASSTTSQEIVAGPPSPTVGSGVSLTPNEADAAPAPASGDTVQFQAVASGPGVSYAVQEGASGGSISPSGLYTAPPTPGTYHVVATSVANPSLGAMATVYVGTPALVDHFSPGYNVLASPKVYAIFWGPPAGFPPDLESDVTSMLQALPGSSYLSIANQYLGGAQIAMTYGGAFYDSSTPPNPPSQTDFDNEVCGIVAQNGIPQNLWPLPAGDPSDLFLLYTTTPPQESNGVPLYCATHGAVSCQNGAYTVAWMPGDVDATGCLWDSACSDGMSVETQSEIYMTAHELMESVTDPTLQSWWADDLYGRPAKDGSEIGDLCIRQLPACVELQGAFWGLPEMWSNADGACVSQ